MAMTKMICSIAILAVAMVGAQQAHADTVSLNLSSATVTLGSAATITLDISGLGNGTALGTFDLNVAFDPGILNFSSATFGDSGLGDQLDLEALGTISSTTPGIGTVELFELSLDSPAVLASSQATSFSLVTLDFHTLGLGQSALSISINALGDQIGNSLNAATLDGSVTVNPSTVTSPEPGTVLLLGCGMLTLAGATRKRISRRALRAVGKAAIREEYSTPD
jgi:hypothetical protein